VKRKKRSWRHFSIERRIAAIRKAFIDNPVSARIFKSRMRLTRYAMLSFSMILLILFIGNLAVDTVAGRGFLALRDQDYETAQEYLEKAAQYPGGGIHQWALFQALLKSGRLDPAGEVLEALLADMNPKTRSEETKTCLIELCIANLLQTRREPCLDTLNRALTLFPQDEELIELKRIIELHFSGDSLPIQTWITKRVLEMLDR